MAEETEKVKVAGKKKKGGWFQKIPTRVLLSPAGMVLVFIGLISDIADVVPVLNIILEIFFLIMFVVIVKPSIKSLIIPVIIEQIPFIKIFPTWTIKMLGLF